jgi:triosephosphate isomerase
VKNNKDIFLGAQNCFWEDKGAYTGEIGPKMLKSMGVEYVILGHSERREYFKENNQEIAKKLERVLKNRLTPIVCIGENSEEKRQELTGQVILEQMQEILKNIGSGNIEKTVLCYEPIWAISSNKPDSLPTENEIMEARLLMKKFLVKKYGKLTADRVKIIYGGSVDQSNVGETCLKTGMNGALIGSASTKPYDFVKIIKEFEK